MGSAENLGSYNYIITTFKFLSIKHFLCCNFKILFRNKSRAD